MERKTFVISYLTDKSGCAEIDESLAIQRALGETMHKHVSKFVVIPEDLASPEATICLQTAAKQLPSFTTREEFLTLMGE